VGKATSDVGADQVLVNLDIYRACLKVHGWQRQTGGKVGNPSGFYRGLEDEGPMAVGYMPTHARTGHQNAPPWSTTRQVKYRMSRTNQPATRQTESRTPEQLRLRA